MSPIHPLEIETPIDELKEVINGQDKPRDAYKKIAKVIRELGTNIPPPVNAYVVISDSLMCFGTSINPHFGNVQETAIMVPMEEISVDKKKRHIDTFLRDVNERTSIQR